MNIHYLLFSLIIAPFSYAYYGVPTDGRDLSLGPYTTVFRIGRDIYNYGTFPNNITKFGIDENQNFYSKFMVSESLNISCTHCFSFVMNNDSVLTSTGDDISDGPNLGFFYLNPNDNTITRPSGYKKLPGSPTQRIYHQAVMPPNKKSVYIFGGVDIYHVNQTYLSILQFDIASSTFISHGNFTFIGGAATMLPSGIVVLAFGSSTINQPDGNDLYDTSSVFLYNTNTNELYKQNVSGTPPQPRGSTPGVLGPDNESIYYFGGSDFNIYIDPDYIDNWEKRHRLRDLSDLVILDTTSWTWYHPSVSGPPPSGRHDHFSLLYEDNTLIIGGGVSPVTTNLNDISVLRNLPLGGGDSNLDRLQWFANSELDEMYNYRRLSTGAIVGIAIGTSIPVIVLFYFLWKRLRAFRRIIWRKRLGEPVWTEILRTIIRMILLGVLLAYIVYAVVRAIESPNLNEVQTVETKKMPMPDIRICSGVPSPPPADFDIVCTFQDGRDCSQYVYTISNSSLLPLLEATEVGPSCQVFVPPLDIYFENIDDHYWNQKIVSIQFELFKKDINQNVTSYHITYYTSQHSPYRTFLGLAGDNSKMSLHDADDLIAKEQLSPNMTNMFNVDDHRFLIAEYSLTETLTLTNSSWNYFGFANIYDTSLDITQNVGTSTNFADPLINVGLAYNPAFALYVNPSKYSIHKITEQRVSTILSGLASAGGIFSVIIAIQTLLFGFRPNSPWGIVHRWSWGRQRKALREQLREEFNTDDVPVPMATPVRGDYQLPTSAFTTLDMPPMNTDNDDQSHGLRLRTVEERLQLMEDLFKTYYIDDEIFQKLNEARKDKSTKDDEKKERVKYETGFSTFHQEDEETPFNKTN